MSHGKSHFSSEQLWPHLPHVGLPWGAIQQHSKHLPSSWVRPNQKKLLSPKRSRCESCPDHTVLPPEPGWQWLEAWTWLWLYLVLHTKNLPLKPWSCHPSPCTDDAFWFWAPAASWDLQGGSWALQQLCLQWDWCWQCVFKPWLETYWPLPTWRGFFANWINFLTISQVISYTVETQNILKIKLMAPLIALRGIFTPAGSF